MAKGKKIASRKKVMVEKKSSKGIEVALRLSKKPTKANSNDTTTRTRTTVRRVQKRDYEEEPELSNSDETSDDDTMDNANDEGSDDDMEDSEDDLSTSTKTSLSVKSSPVEEDEKVIEKILGANAEAMYFVKYKGKSYLHCEWLSEDAVKSMDLSKWKRYHQKPPAWYSDTEMINPQYTQIDRIIAQSDLFEDARYFLVKWKSLGYDLCSWEKETDIQDKTEIDEYLKRQKISYTKSTAKRPNVGSFKALEESPKFKGDFALRKYQLEGLNWLLFCWMKNQGSIIADEMGLGKTIQTVSFLNELHRQFKINGPFLVIAPLSTIAHWEREVKNWTNLNAVVYHGSQHSRQIIYEHELFNGKGRSNYKFNVLITTYEMAMSGISHLKPIPWKVGILDEAHQLKNKQSKRTEILKQYSIEHRILATGTPLQNRLEELFALLNFLDPAEFDDEAEFLRQYGDLKKSEDVNKLQEVLKPLMLRRLKEDVEKSIPIKEETIIEVELTGPQKKYYKAILERNFTFLSKGCKGTNMPNLINVMMELRKCCIHPYLIKGAEERIIDEAKALSPEEQFNLMVQASGKLVLVDKLLKKLKENGHKVLIFSQMTKCLDILADYLRGREYPFERIDGAIRGDMRQASIDRYSNDPSSFVFLLCTRAGGVGINLTAADTVIIFDSDWNPQNDLQAQARCHRIGQKKSVKIYRLITRNTYEREMFDRAGMKLGLDRAVLQKMSFDDEKPNNLSKKEVENLLKKGAYGVMMENDEDSIKFCEEDIDQILERRTTVIVHDNSANQGSIFSKASFTAGPEENAVEIDDPDFWGKWAKNANLDVDTLLLKDSLIIDEPRQRKKYERETIDGAAQSDNSSDAEIRFEKDKKGPRLWSFAERVRLEKAVLNFGFGNFRKIKKFFSFRTLDEIILVTRQLILFCYELEKGDEKIRSDFNRVIKPFIKKMEAEKFPEEDEEMELSNTATEGEIVEENPLTDVNDIDHLKFLEQTLPILTPKQVAETRSFLKKAPSEYREHLKKRSKFLLSRVYFIMMCRMRIDYESENEDEEPASSKNKIDYTKINTPKIIGMKPAEWWQREHDQSLVLGMCKHGYQNFEELRYDSELAFSHQQYVDKKKEHVSEEIVLEEANAEEDDNNEEQIDDENEEKMEEEFDKNEKDDNNSEIPMENDENNSSHSEMLDIEGGKEGDTAELVWPGKSEFLSRMKRLCLALDRKYQTEVRKGKVSTAIEVNDKWNKRERSEFTRILNTYGIPQPLEIQKVDDMNIYEFVDKYDWKMFRSLSYNNGFEKKTDDMMDAYFKEFILMCRDSANKLKKLNKRKKRDDEEEDDLKVPREDSFQESVLESIATEPKSLEPIVSATNLETENAPLESLTGLNSSNETVNIAAESPTEIAPAEEGSSHKLVVELASERSRRLLRRIEILLTLRHKVLTFPEFEEQLTNKIKRINGLPDWWIPVKHDIGLLKGVARYGFGRMDLIVQDSTLPFFGMEFEEPQEVENSDDDEPIQGVDEAEPKAIKKKKKKGPAKAKKETTAPTTPTELETPTEPGTAIEDGSMLTSPVQTDMPKKLLWPKEAFILRRVEYLSDLLLKNKTMQNNAIKRKRVKKSVMDIGNLVGLDSMKSPTEAEYKMELGGMALMHLSQTPTIESPIVDVLGEHNSTFSFHEQ